MFVVVSYDISSRQAGNRVRKTCESYLRLIQKSVFEGEITEKKLGRLKDKLAGQIDPAVDSVVIYRFDSSAFAKKERIGVSKTNESEFI